MVTHNGLDTGEWFETIIFNGIYISFQYTPGAGSTTTHALFYRSDQDGVSLPTCFYQKMDKAEAFQIASGQAGKFSTVILKSLQSLLSSTMGKEIANFEYVHMWPMRLKEWNYWAGRMKFYKFKSHAEFSHAQFLNFIDCLFPVARLMSSK